jgi:hypothetical protein
LGGGGGLEGNGCSSVGQERRLFWKGCGVGNILKIWFEIVCLSLSFFFGGGDFAFPKNHFFKVIDRHEVHY